MKTVHSVAEYLVHLSGIEQIRTMSYTVSSITFFRGQANASWGLSPSLYREGLFQSESVLLTEIKHACPNEIPDNRFDTLVKMQHYGMPTRLLDATTNPLVALYFACESQHEKDKDGAVYAFPNLPVSWSTEPIVELIMDFVFDYDPRHVRMDEMLKHVKGKSSNAGHMQMPDDIESLLHYLTMPVFPVMPAKTNARIEAQDGTFFIFGMTRDRQEERKHSRALGPECYSFNPVYIATPDQLWAKTETLMIPSSAKDRILGELDMMGINERKLFPDLPHQIAYAVKTLKKIELK